MKITKIRDEILLNFEVGEVQRNVNLIFNVGSFLPKGACKSDRSRRELSNEYLLANIGFDTAENEHSKAAKVI